MFEITETRPRRRVFFWARDRRLCALISNPKHICVIPNTVIMTKVICTFAQICTLMFVMNEFDTPLAGYGMFTLPRLFLLAFLTGIIGIARAEQRGVYPADMPTSYRAECGDCHIAFAPDLLTADSWRSLMNGLGEHFGDDARIDAKTRDEIEGFLVRNAGRALRTKKNGDPLRLTDTLWFHRRHGRVKDLFQDPRVVSKANCTACHRHADDGRYDEYTPLSRKFR